MWPFKKTAPPGLAAVVKVGGVEYYKDGKRVDINELAQQYPGPPPESEYVHVPERSRTERITKKQLEEIDDGTLLGELARRGFTFGDSETYHPSTCPNAEVIREAIAMGHDVEIEYEDTNEEISERRVTPLEIIKPAENTLRAYCHTRKAQRRFRLDRIHEAAVVEREPQFQKLYERWKAGQAYKG